MNCWDRLIKAIDLYIEKADNNLKDELEAEGYADVKNTLKYINDTEDEVSTALVHFFIIYPQARNFESRTLGVTDYDMDAPLTAIRRLMMESNGLVTIAFRRNIIQEGICKPKSDIYEKEKKSFESMDNKFILSN